MLQDNFRCVSVVGTSLYHVITPSTKVVCATASNCFSNRHTLQPNGHSLLHAGKDSTFQFLETVLDEVMELFPSKHIHIGGDECPKTRWASCEACQARIKAEGLSGEEQLQTYFINRVAQHLRKQVGILPMHHPSRVLDVTVG